MDILIELSNVSRRFKHELIIKNLTLSFSQNGITALVAPNATGKTTLMSILAGLMSPTSGFIRYTNGDDPKDVALLLAGDKNLYLKNTVKENIFYAAALNGHGSTEVKKSLPAIYEWFPELDSLWNAIAESLSYGQKRLVALACAVVAQNRYLLVDEAAEGLDVAHVEQLMHALRKMSADQAIIISSHDLRFVSECADDVLFLSDGDIIKYHAFSEATLRERYELLFGEVLA